MDDILRDIQRLEHITQSTMALERFSVMTRIGDFVRYYFSRFLKNAHHALKDFSQSEIEQFNQRYHKQVGLTLKDPLLSIKDVIVPIPKGMVGSYHATLISLTEILSKIHVETLKDDLANVLKAVESADASLLHKPSLTQAQFNRSITMVGKLYSVNGLTHTTAEHALVSLAETQDVNLILQGLSKEYYPQAIEMANLVDSIDKVHGSVSIPPEQAGQFSAALMSVAYRVSLYAVVLEHAQDMEHTFTKALKTLLDISARTK